MDAEAAAAAAVGSKAAVVSGTADALGKTCTGGFYSEGKQTGTVNLK